MRYTESKKFVFSRPPSGTDIVELIKTNELHAWRLKIEHRHTGMTNLGTLGGYVYDVIFEKDVEA